MDHTRIKREPLQNLPNLPLAGNDQTPSTPIRARRASHLADVDPFDPFDPFDPSDQENLQSPSSDGQGARPIKTERVDAQVANRFRALLHEQELRKKEKEISSRFRDRADVNEQRAIQDQLNVHQDSTTSTPRRGVKAEASASGPHAHQFPPPSQRRVCFSCCSPQVDRECGSCKKATYCSRNCQRQDWSRHAPLCRQNKTDVGPKYLNAKREQPDIKPVPQHVQGRPVAPIPVIKRDPDHMAVSSTAPIAEDPSDGDASQLSMAAFNSREQAQRAIDHEVAKNLFDLPPVEIPPEQRQPTPGAMTCKLLPHQRVGLTWLMKQEASTRKGSILADTPGLGKTIEALALMLARPPQDPARKTTLIVAPTAVLSQWEQEIHDKVKPGFRLKTKIYHGMKKRDMTVSKLLSYDVVLTTYGTLAWERESWYTKKRQWKPILLASNTYFHRIILDEAHHVKNRNSSRSQAVSMLKGTYRLAMTGTPLMNNAGEIFSLIRFLDISPYNEWRHYQRDFDGPIRRKNEGDRREAIRKLQIVIRSIVLRRTSNDKIDGKQILNLPEMSQEDVPAEFDEDQMIFYKALEHQSQIKMNKYLTQRSVMRFYSHIFILLLRLRQCCCHPHLIKDHSIPEEARLGPKEMIELAMKFDDHVVERLAAQEDFDCLSCNDSVSNPIIIYPCGHLLCGSCFSGFMNNNHEYRADDDEEADTESVLDVPCPSEGCTHQIRANKVICYNYFKEAHSLDESEVDMEDDEDIDSDEEDDEEDDEDNVLGGFIVPDTEGLDEDSDEVDNNLDDRGIEQTPKVSTQDAFPVSRENRVMEDSDSDMDNLPSLEDVCQSVRAKREEGKAVPTASSILETPSQSTKRALPFKRTIERKRSEPSSGLGKDKAVDSLRLFSRSDEWLKEEEGVKSSNGTPRDHINSDQEDMPSPTRNLAGLGKRKRGAGQEPRDDVKRARNGKGKAKPIKKKQKLVSLADLKKEGQKSAQAKKRYLAKLRESYESSAKIDKTMELLASIRDEKPGEKTLVFSFFTSFLDLLEIPIHDEGYNYRRYDGSMTRGDRDDAVKDFMNKPEVQVLMISLGAGNAGLNLFKATQVVILDPFWNPSIEDQAVGRAHRIGQNKPVTVHRVLVADTVEDRILALQENKRQLVREVLDNETPANLQRLSVQELRGLFGMQDR